MVILKGGQISEQKETLHCYNSAGVLHVHGHWPHLPQFYSIQIRKCQRHHIGIHDILPRDSNPSNAVLWSVEIKE